MKKITYLVFIGIAALFMACDNTTEVAVSLETGEAEISGKVLPAGSLASIAVTQGSLFLDTDCDSSGNFSITGLKPGSCNLTISASGYGTQFRNVDLVEGGHNEIADITLNRIPYPVSSVSPTNKSTNVSHTSRMEIYFKKEMDSASVKDAFSITPSIEGVFVWENSFKTLRFDPDVNLLSSTVYTITLDTTAYAYDGEALEFQLVFNYTTAGFMVTGVYPEDNATGIRTYTDPRITFNVLADPSSLSKRLHVSPATEFTTYWSGTSLYIEPVGGYWDSATTYTVTVEDSLTDIHGTMLGDSTSFSFTTVGGSGSSSDGTLDIDSVDREENVYLTTDIEIDFESEMDIESVEAAFQFLSYEDSLLPGIFEWNSSNTGFDFEPFQDLHPAKSYTVIMGSCISVDGDTIPADTAVFTTKALYISSTVPKNGTVNCTPNLSARINFNASINMLTIQDAITISPAIDFEVTSGGDKSILIKPSYTGYWAANTEYTVTIDSSALDYWGGTMENDYILKFTPEPLMVESVDPFNGDTTISTSASFEVEFNSLINTLTVDSCFTLQDSATGTAVEGTFTNLWGYGFEFTPDNILTSNTTYKMAVDTTVEDRYGVKLAKPWVSYFRTNSN